MRIFNHIAILFLKSYQILISPILPSSCRFYPSCSNYAIEAFKNFNPLLALILSVKRVLRCHPFNPGGYDPIPIKKAGRNG